jgi:hypothetical protein
MSKRKSLIGNDSSTHRRALFLTLCQERFAGLKTQLWREYGACRPQRQKVGIGLAGCNGVNSNLLASATEVVGRWKFLSVCNGLIVNQPVGFEQQKCGWKLEVRSWK